MASLMLSMADGSRPGVSVTEMVSWMLMVTVSGSSFWMVPRPRALLIVAPEAFARSTKKVSSGSNVSSPVTSMAIVFVVSPAANVRVPAFAA